MPFDHKKFVADRIAGNPVTGADVADFDAYAALYTLSMTPSLFNYVNALNTVQFTKLTKHAQAKIMEGFNKMPISEGYIRAYPSEINAINDMREMVMDVYDVSMLEADMLIKNKLVDMDVVKEYYDYKFNGIMPKAKRAKKAKQDESVEENKWVIAETRKGCGDFPPSSGS